MKPGSLLATVLFSLVAIVHLLRLVGQWEITVAGSTVPQWISIVGMLLPAAIAWMLWRESRQQSHPAGKTMY